MRYTPRFGIKVWLDMSSANQGPMDNSNLSLSESAGAWQLHALPPLNQDVVHGGCKRTFKNFRCFIGSALQMIFSALIIIFVCF